MEKSWFELIPCCLGSTIWDHHRSRHPRQLFWSGSAGWNISLSTLLSQSSSCTDAVVSQLVVFNIWNLVSIGPLNSPLFYNLSKKKKMIICPYPGFYCILHGNRTTQFFPSLVFFLLCSPKATQSHPSDRPLYPWYFFSLFEGHPIAVWESTPVGSTKPLGIGARPRYILWN